MPYTFLTNFTTERGTRSEPDFVIPDGTIIAIRNNDYGYGEVQYWGVLSSQDYELLGGADPLVYGSLLLYQKTHAFAFQNSIGQSMQPTLYVPKDHRQQYVNCALFSWSP